MNSDGQKNLYYHSLQLVNLFIVLSHLMVIAMTLVAIVVVIVVVAVAVLIVVVIVIWSFCQTLRRHLEFQNFSCFFFFNFVLTPSRCLFVCFFIFFQLILFSLVLRLLWLLLLSDCFWAVSVSIQFLLGNGMLHKSIAGRCSSAHLAHAIIFYVCVNPIYFFVF